MAEYLNLLGSLHSNLDRKSSLGNSDLLQGQKGWDGCGLPLTTTAALVVTVRGVTVLLSSWEEWGEMNYKPKRESIKTARGLLNYPPLRSATLDWECDGS